MYYYVLDYVNGRLLKGYDPNSNKESDIALHEMLDYFGLNIDDVEWMAVNNELVKEDFYLINLTSHLDKLLVSFKAYYIIQVKGLYNMRTEADKVKKITGISDEDYEYILKHYSELRSELSDWCDDFDKAYLESLRKGQSN